MPEFYLGFPSDATLAIFSPAPADGSLDPLAAGLDAFTPKAPARLSETSFDLSYERLFRLSRYAAMPRYKPSATRWRWSPLRSSFSSLALLIKEISERIEGMFAPIRPTKGPFFTPRFFS